ncbi:hypothetical protein CTheo_4475 [Ceratobasidium theobromae]|uniref:Uncharacterized protein n=1 Tax=Ceratobasidium theobromae TaxID=1582974 RepID=A0A5N5QKM9_9AGAM|nr:hypothetical protein CTheo_4475 [Ceratobasidium theobromae]
MNAFRFAIRTVRPTRVVIASRALPLRSFASTPLRRASEDADSFMAAFKDTPLFTKFAEQPEAVAALSDVAEFLKKNGALILRLLRAPVNYLYLDIDMTIPLSSMTMFKLATNSEFRELIRKALDEFKKAGIEINPENAMELLSPGFNPPKGR